MPVSPFIAGGQGLIELQPSNQKLVFFSEDNADNSQNITFNGSATETHPLDGVYEGITNNAFTRIDRIALDAVTAGAVNVFAEGTPAVGDIGNCSNQPTNGDSVIIGLGDQSRDIAYIFVTALGAPGAGEAHVLIGANADETADNLASAINDLTTGTSGPVDGVDWTNPSGPSEFVVADVPSGGTVVITDLIGVRRSQSWKLTTDSGWQVRPPVGGQTGFRLATVAAGETEIYDAVTLSTPLLDTDTLPGSLVFTADWVAIQGSEWTVELRSTMNGALFLVPSLEVANDPEHVLRSFPLTLGSNPLDEVINSATVSDDGKRYEFLRVKFTNASTDAQPVHAQVIWGR